MLHVRARMVTPGRGTRSWLWLRMRDNSILPRPADHMLGHSCLSWFRRSCPPKFLSKPSLPLPWRSYPIYFAGWGQHELAGPIRGLIPSLLFLPGCA